MNKVFTFGVLIVLALLALGGYWYFNPHHAPSFFRHSFEVRSPHSPMSGFKPPQF